MSDRILSDVFKKQLFDLLEETFSAVQGIYLDRGTSLYETLDTISSDEASRPVSGNCASIAAQVNHVRFYLDVLLESCFQNKDLGKIDWDESWQMREVTTKEWDDLKKSLRKCHQNVLQQSKTNRSGWVRMILVPAGDPGPYHLPSGRDPPGFMYH